MGSEKARIIAFAIVLFICCLLIVKLINTNQSPQDQVHRSDKTDKLVVFTATRYRSTQEVRFKQAMETLTALKEQGLTVVVVDNSPDPRVRELMSTTAARVSKQQAKGKKGAAFREAAVLASQVDGVTSETWLCWQEPEKTDMAHHWLKAVDTTASVVIPARALSNFKKTYPIEQFHSETFANLYLDALAAAALKKLRRSQQLPVFPPHIDWLFGPLAFRTAHLALWSEFDGAMYDAQIVPITHAARKGVRVASATVPFDASVSMKQQEEGNLHFIEKRLWQLNLVGTTSKKGWENPL